MIWSEVAQRYMESFDRARIERRHYISPGFSAKALDKNPGELPPLKLDHLVTYDRLYRNISTRSFYSSKLFSRLYNR